MVSSTPQPLYPLGRIAQCIGNSVDPRADIKAVAYHYTDWHIPDLLPNENSAYLPDRKSARKVISPVIQWQGYGYVELHHYFPTRLHLVAFKHNDFIFTVLEMRLTCKDIVTYRNFARQQNNTRKQELCFVMWSAHATIPEACFLCIRSVQSGSLKTPVRPPSSYIRSTNLFFLEDGSINSTEVLTTTHKTAYHHISKNGGT